MRSIKRGLGSGAPVIKKAGNRMKQHWQEKLIQHVLGTQGPLDEQRLAVLGRASINAVIGLLAFQAVVMVAGLAWPIRDFQDAFFTLIFVELAGTLWIVYATVTRMIRRNGLDQTEVTPQHLTTVKRRLLQRTILTAPLVVFTYHLMGVLFALNEKPFTVAFLDGHQFISSLIFGVIFCPLMYGIQVHRIRVIKEDD
ncbi:DUF3278 domain-containing protein [Lacticaseibacillus daqingensis]|uniref:DUF3278 domain-containing protein n=1 Tax=Lacticaseibacillus daqingensis TaxID=2486014 RepID=UPI0013DD9413|nr:DUF3278 domain-containing protein [Lacticaseibacillus daqingensis]